MTPASHPASEHGWVDFNKGLSHPAQMETTSKGDAVGQAAETHVRKQSSGIPKAGDDMLTGANKRTHSDQGPGSGRVSPFSPFAPPKSSNFWENLSENELDRAQRLNIEAQQAPSMSPKAPSTAKHLPCNCLSPHHRHRHGNNVRGRYASVSSCIVASLQKHTFMSIAARCSFHPLTAERIQRPIVVMQ